MDIERKLKNDYDLLDCDSQSYNIDNTREMMIKIYNNTVDENYEILKNLKHTLYAKLTSQHFIQLYKDFFEIFATEKDMLNWISSDEEICQYNISLEEDVKNNRVIKLFFSLKINLNFYMNIEIARDLILFEFYTPNSPVFNVKELYKFNNEEIKAERYNMSVNQFKDEVFKTSLFFSYDFNKKV